MGQIPANEVGSPAAGLNAAEVGTYGGVALFGYTGPTNVLSQTFDRTGGVANQASSMTLGTLQMSLIPVTKGVTYSKASWVTGTTALGTPTNQWSALYDLNGNQVATSADALTAAWAASTLKTFTFTTAYVGTYTGYMYVGLVVAGATACTLMGSAVPAAVTTIPPILSATALTSLTAPATTAAGTLTPVATVPWAYLT